MTFKYFYRSMICLLLLSLPVFTQKLVVDSSFTPSINGAVKFVEVLSDGKIMIAGDFTSVNGATRHRIARLNADGSLDTSFEANWLIWIDNSISINAMKVLPDGKILIGGRLPYGIVLGPQRVLRLNADGGFDNTMISSPFLGNENIFPEFNKIEQLPNGKILICGKFNLPNNNQKPHLARYNADGTYDATFATVIDNECQDVEVLPDGRYYVSGFYRNINGNPSRSLTRFNADDSIDASFDAAPVPNTSDHTYYYGIKLQSDGKILTFRSAGCCFERASRLNPDGSLHTNFQTSLDEPGDFAVQSNGKVTIVGEFENVFGQAGELNRFNTDGTHDPSLPRMGFMGSTFPAYPNSASFTTDGKLLVGGNFTRFNLASGGAVTNQAYLARFVPEAIPIKPKFDFDGDGRADMAVYRPGTGVWYQNRSGGGFYVAQFGLPQDKPIVADYDGDNRADIAVFRDGLWYWLRSSDSAFAYRVCGQAGDIPQPSNYNAYCLIYRPSAALFYTQAPFQPASSVEFRDMTLSPNDKPVVADYDGDGRDDLAVFRDGNWFYMASNNLQTRHYQFGLAGDKPVVGDFDGDLRSDYAVFRPSTGTWYIQKSTEGFSAVQWGLADDLPVPADYDGDGKTDIAVFRPSDGVWYQMRSNNTLHIEQFGLSGDIPVQLR